MKIIHIADLHLGQIIYQNYDRCDEHEYFFSQLSDLCLEEEPDALIVCGDIFDIQQPSAATRKWFTDHFAGLSARCRGMAMVIVAGNHDSASRIHADNAIWALADTLMIGTPPSGTEPEKLASHIAELSEGYIIAVPYLSSPREELLQPILDYVAERNTDGKPVVMTGHLPVTGMDATGHDFEIGKIRTVDTRFLGTGYDYLALGHIHKPQTIGYPEDAMKETQVEYPSPVVRYSGSALHVSCDETYPHTITIAEIDRHEGRVSIRQKRIRQLRHFYVLPLDGSSFTNPEEALEAIGKFAREKKSGYLRLRVDYSAPLPPDFNQKVYDMLSDYGDEVRYNPKILWTGEIPSSGGSEEEEIRFQVADFQEMENPVNFLLQTIDQFPGLDPETLTDAFREIEEEVRRMEEEERPSLRRQKNRSGSTETPEK